MNQTTTPHAPQPHVIPDGYTKAGYIKAEPDFYESLDFRYRPMVPGERQEYIFRIQHAQTSETAYHKGDSKALMAITVEIVAAKIIDMVIKSVDQAGNLYDMVLFQNGQASDNAKAMLRRMEPNLLHNLRDVLMAWRPSDERPTTGETRALSEAPDPLAMALDDSSDTTPRTTMQAEVEQQTADAGN